MAKLDWTKASLRERDPARVQRTDSFITCSPQPKKQSKPKKPVKAQAATPFSKAALKARDEARALVQRRKAEAARIKQAAKAAEPVKGTNRRGAKKVTPPHAKRVALEVQRKVAEHLAAEEARKQSPTYIAAQQAKRTRIAQIEQARRLVDKELAEKRAIAVRAKAIENFPNFAAYREAVRGSAALAITHGLAAKLPPEPPKSPGVKKSGRKKSRRGRAA
jgi:hypothetical protein